MPMGGTNQHHMPTEFFGVYRPEGENTILPCTWKRVFRFGASTTNGVTK